MAKVIGVSGLAFWFCNMFALYFLYNVLLHRVKFYIQSSLKFGEAVSSYRKSYFKKVLKIISVPDFDLFSRNMITTKMI